MDAASINGTAAHALDYDDCSDTLGGHPSAPILPALFALAETRGANGQDFIAAYVAGWETETRIARGVNFHHYEKGWHPTATLGVFGADRGLREAAGSADGEDSAGVGFGGDIFLRSEGEFRDDDETAACRAGGAQRVVCRFAGVGGFHLLNRCARTSTGLPACLQRRGQFHDRSNRGGVGVTVDIVDPGLTIKQYPCCGSTHPAIDAMLMLFATMI